MDISVPFNFNENLRNFLQRCGYAAFLDPNTQQQSFTRRLGGDFYPRFHIYINEKDSLNFLSLHLDQKKPSYAGAHAHSGEYNGPLVDQEASRIRGLIKNQLDNQNQKPTPVPQPNKNGFFSRLFK